MKKKLNLEEKSKKFPEHKLRSIKKNVWQREIIRLEHEKVGKGILRPEKN